MFGFLLKIVLLTSVVGAIVGVIYIKTGGLPDPKKAASDFTTAVKNVDSKTLLTNASDSLDKLITHPDKNSPVVLGVKITNDSLDTVVNVLQSLPPEQINTIKTALCAPAPPPAEGN
jgi:hypothetical protein